LSTFTGPAVADAQPRARRGVIGRQAGPRVVVVPALAGIPGVSGRWSVGARQARALARWPHRRAASGSRPQGQPRSAGVIAALTRQRPARTHAEDRRGPPRRVTGMNDAVQAVGSVLSSGAIMAAALREAGIAARDMGWCDLASIHREMAPPARARPSRCSRAARPLCCRRRWCRSRSAHELSLDRLRCRLPRALGKIPAAPACRNSRSPRHWSSRALASRRCAESLFGHLARHPDRHRSARRADGPSLIIDGRPSVAAPAALGCRRRVVHRGSRRARPGRPSSCGVS
jgi:hypothetical protein